MNRLTPLAHLARANLTRVFWGVAASLMLLVLGLSVFGWQEAYATSNTPLSLLDLLLGVLKVFSVDLALPSDEAQINTKLKLARLLGPLVLLLVTGKVGLGLFAEYWTAFRCRWLRGHVLVCGAGYKGRFVAEQFLTRDQPGRPVVIIDRDPQNDALSELRAIGALVLCGNARDAELLRRVGAAEAAYVFAVTGADEANLEIAVEIERLRRAHLNPRPLAVYVHVKERRLRELFERQHPFSEIDRKTHLELHLFDCISTAARALFAAQTEHMPYHALDDPAPSFLVIGEGHFVEEIVREMVVNAHFGNNRKPRIVVMTADRRLPGLFVRRFPHVELVAELQFIRLAERRLEPQDLAQIEGIPTFDLAVVGLPADVETLETAEVLARLTAFHQPQPARPVPFGLRALYACLLPESSLARIGSDPTAFRAQVVSLAREGCGLEVLLDGKLDQAARRRHEQWLAGLPPGTRKPTAVPWEQLPEFHREDNRSAALHGRIKRAARRQVPTTEWDALKERLARAEHNRWMGNRIMHGWRTGPRDDEAKFHPNLVPYDELDESTKQYDRNDVEAAWQEESQPPAPPPVSP